MKISKKLKRDYFKEKHKRDIFKKMLSVTASILLLTGCSNSNIESNQVDNLNNSSTTIVNESDIDKNKDLSKENANKENTEASNSVTAESNSDNTEDMFDGYKIIKVDGGDLSGHREPNVAVDIGFGDREYWAFTNEHGQLVKVVAKKIILQDDSKEPVNSKGRYYDDEAKVPGVESKYLDEGKQIVL